MEENRSDCNANVVPMKAGSAINMLDIKAYKKEDFHTYQQLIDQLM